MRSSRPNGFSECRLQQPSAASRGSLRRTTPALLRPGMRLQRANSTIQQQISGPDATIQVLLSSFNVPKEISRYVKCQSSNA